MNVPDQEDLILRACNGDAPAFEILVKSYYPSILNYCYRSLGSRADAEDVTQDVFVKAARKLHNLKEPAAFKGWLYSIARSTCADLSRSRGRQTEREQIYHEAQNLSQKEESPGHRIWEFVARLPEKLKDALVLVYWEGVSHAHAATVLDCAESTVSWRVYEAKKKLKTMMEVGR